MACAPLDAACAFREAIIGLILPILLPIILFLVLLFVVPKAGWRGVVIAIVGIFLLLWYYGIIPGLPRLS